MTIHELELELNGYAMFSHSEGEFEDYPPKDISNAYVQYTDLNDENRYYFELSNGVWGNIHLEVK